MSIFKRFLQEKKTEFKFTEPENKACFTCEHVLSEGRPILYATHDSDGDWQFLCGESHQAENVRVISLKQVTELDQTINRLYEMPLGVGATRESVNDKWELFRISDG